MAIRTDASAAIGIGHIMRCLTLARLLRDEAGAQVAFICNGNLPDALREEIGGNGFALFLQPAVPEDRFDEMADARQSVVVLSDFQTDWVIVDHYRLNYNWESFVRPYTRKLMVIDDLAGVTHYCDLLLNQNIGQNWERRYADLLPQSCVRLLGPAYVLLREEFSRHKDRAVCRKECRSVLVSFGGSDPTNETGKVLSVIKDYNGALQSLYFHIVAGPANTRRNELRFTCRGIANTVFYPEVNHMAELLSAVDLAIGAGGISLWERGYMGVPTALITVADNQVEAAEEAEKLGISWNLGTSNSVREADIIGLLLDILDHPDKLEAASAACFSVTAPLRNRPIHPIVSIMAQMN